MVKSFLDLFSFVVAAALYAMSAVVGVTQDGGTRLVMRRSVVLLLGEVKGAGT